MNKRLEILFLCLLCAILGGLGGASIPRASAQAGGSTDEGINIRVYRDESPGVVNITSTTYVQDFFDVYPQKGTGSGSIIDKSGLILTNFHVVRGAEDLQVTLNDKSIHKARVVGADPEDDIALVRIDQVPANLHVIQMASSSNLLVGQKVLAIGNPFGLDRTLTTGVISGLGRPLKTDAGTTIENVIQTDAAINPGNSGGPLLNSNGRLIGVNTAIYSPSGGSIGIGFAIPINVVKRVLPDLETQGHVTRPWLGISSTPLTPRLAHNLGLPIKQGVIITRVTPGGLAAQAGLRGANQLVMRDGHWYLPADIIVKVNGVPTPDQESLQNALIKLQPTETVSVQVVRDSAVSMVRVHLAPKPAQATE